MRIAKHLTVALLAAMALSGCSTTVSGSASPAGGGQGTVTQVDQGGFDKNAAAAALLDQGDLPDYTQLPDLDFGDLDSGLTGADDATLTIDPPQCAELYAAGSLSSTEEALISQSAMRMLIKGTAESDMAAVIEVIAPASAVAETMDRMQVPAACDSITISQDDSTVAMSAKEVPLGIGATSAAVEMTMNGVVAGQPIDMKISLAVIAESKGGLILSVTGSELVPIVQAAYDKALPVLR